MKKDLAHQFFSIPSLISVASHGSALLIIAATDSLGVLPERWITQSLLVVAAMLAASLFGRRKSAYPFFLIVRFILILVLSAPTSASTSIKIVLMLPYLTDLLAYAPGSRVATCLATVSVMVAVFAQQGMIAWGVATSRPGLEQRLLQGLIGLGWIALTARMSRSQKRIQIQSFEIDRLNTVIDRLTDANISFQNYARSVADVTIQQERRRISKDIHDTVGYTFTNVRMLIEACIAIVGRKMPKVLELLLDAKSQSLEALAEVRRELGDMRNYHAEMLRLPNAMQKIGEMFEKATGVRVTLELAELPWEQNPKAEIAIYHLVQEGLTNAFRHGRATEVTVLFRTQGDVLLTIVRDNGDGASEIAEGIGLRGMSERFEELGGSVVCCSVADGFELRATLHRELMVEGTDGSHSRLVG